MHHEQITKGEAISKMGFELIVHFDKVEDIFILFALRDITLLKLPFFTPSKNSTIVLYN